MKKIEPLNWKAVSIKGRSKRKIYKLIVIRGKYYLPPESQTRSTFVHDVMCGKKASLLTSQITA